MKPVNKRPFEIFFKIFLLVLILIISLLQQITYFQIPGLPKDHQYVIENWKKEPIIDISASKQKCNEYLINYLYEGTNEGCDCSQSTNSQYTSKMFKSKCQTSQLSSSCTQINSVPNKMFNYWDIEGNQMHFCVDRAQGINFTTMDCSNSKYVKCGKNQDMCFPPNYKCPINSIKYTLLKPSDNYEQIIQLDKGSIFISREEENQNPIVFGIASEGKGVCKYFKEDENVINQRNQYFLNKKIKNGCTNGISTRFQLLSETNEMSFFDANSYKEFIDNLPNYEITSEIIYGLYIQQYVLWKNEQADCKNLMMPFFNLQSKLDEIISFWIISIVLNWILLVFYALFVNMYNIFFINKLNYKCLSTYFYVIFIIILSYFTINITTLVLTLIQGNVLNNLKQNQCSDEETNSYIDIYHIDYMDSLFIYQIVLFTFSIIVLLLSIFMYKMYFVYYRKNLFTVKDVNVVADQNKNKEQNKIDLNNQEKNLQNIEGNSQNIDINKLQNDQRGPNSLSEVTPFLERFFSDTTVIRIPFGLGPYIGKLRGPAKVTKHYEKIGGRSPIKDWTIKQGEKMIDNLNKISPQTSPHIYFPAFRYGLPLYNEQIDECIQKYPQVENFVFFSQFPQYSCTTSGNSLRNCIKHLQEKHQNHNKKIHLIDRWFDNKNYIKAMANILKKDIESNFEENERDKVLILFSAHSLPVDFVQEGDVYPYEMGYTAESIIKEGQFKNSYRITWQSKVGVKQWLAPSTTNALEQYSKKGWEHVIIVPLGFTSDHLEILYEIDHEIIEDFCPKLNYKKVIRSRSLNDDDLFCQALAEIVASNLADQTYRSPNLNLRCPDCKFSECNLLSK